MATSTTVPAVESVATRSRVFLTRSLSLLYVVFAINVARLYGVCRWYAGLKAARPRWWMRYI